MCRICVKFIEINRLCDSNGAPAGVEHLYNFGAANLELRGLSLFERGLSPLLPQPGYVAVRTG